MRLILSGQLCLHLDGSPLTIFQLCLVLHVRRRLKVLVFQNLSTHLISLVSWRRRISFSYGHLELEITK